MSAGVRIGTLPLEVALLNASGAFDLCSDDDEWRASPEPARHLGAYVTKTVTRSARAGNPEPRVALAGEGSLYNSVGLANPGIESVVAGAWRSWLAPLACPIVLSVGGDEGDLAAIVGIVEQAGCDWVAAYELNLSCPNDAAAHAGGLVAGHPQRAADAVARVRARTRRPIVAKLSAQCTDVAGVARAVVTAGCDAVAAINSVPVVALDDEGTQLLGTANGGLTGRAIHPVALRCVAEIAAAVDVPVIGIGGIANIADVRRMRACGASAVAIGTAAALSPHVFGLVAQSTRSAPHMTHA